MAFPASTQIQVDALQRARSAALEVKGKAQRKRDTMAAQSISGRFVLSVLDDVTAAIAEWDGAASVPGIDAYAQAQYDDTNLDISVEFNAMRAAAVSVRDWIVANLPVDANGWLLLRSVDASGQLSDRTFTSAQTEGLRSELDALIATIN